MTTTYELIPLAEGMAQAEKEAERFLYLFNGDKLMEDFFMATIRNAYSAGYIDGQYGRKIETP